MDVVDELMAYMLLQRFCNVAYLVESELNSSSPNSLRGLVIIFG